MEDGEEKSTSPKNSNAEMLKSRSARMQMERGGGKRDGSRHRLKSCPGTYEGKMLLEITSIV